jgi:hypothetical protein
MGFEEAMDAIAQGVEVLGIVTLVLGLAAALVRAGLALLGGQGANEGYRIIRTVFGRSILLGLDGGARPATTRVSTAVGLRSMVRMGPPGGPALVERQGPVQRRQGVPASP